MSRKKKKESYIEHDVGLNLKEANKNSSKWSHFIWAYSQIIKMSENLVPGAIWQRENIFLKTH